MDEYSATYCSLHQNFLTEVYNKLLEYKTISADSACLDELVACANYIKDFLENCGLQVTFFSENGPPILIGRYKSPNRDAKTVLIYNHYDVQPIDPIEEWKSPPFSPTWVDQTVFARGSQDNKGQLMAVLLAVKALTENGGPPCNLILVLDGEEENGSATLSSFLQKKNLQLRADYTLIVDSLMRKENVPSIQLGIRGLVALTVTVQGSHVDLHSGLEGGLAYNPLHALVKMLSSLRNEDGSITVPGFYDAVLSPSQEELQHLTMLFDEHHFFSLHGHKPTGGERAFSPRERNWLRPTLEINGIHGGYGGSGSKTIIPKMALAKITCRLVPDQDPLSIALNVKKYLENQSPDGVTTTVTIHEGMGIPFRNTATNEGTYLLKKAMEAVFHTEVEFLLDGASIPIIPLLHTATGGQTLIFGTGLSTDCIHAPNEHFDVNRLEKCFQVVYTFIASTGKNR